MKNSADNVFGNIPCGDQERGLLQSFLSNNDFAANTRRAFQSDLVAFVRWFFSANAEPLTIARITTRDVSDFRDHLHRTDGKAIATVNRALVTVRQFLGWLVTEGQLTTSPATKVRELRKQQLAPKGLPRSDVRKLLREVELRGDVRANAIFSVFLFTGCRVSDLVTLELRDLMLAERSGSVVFRYGKGNKQRSVPVPLAARRALQTYLESRPPINTAKVFVGERGSLTDRGIRAVCDKYSGIIGIKIHPHLLRHTMAHEYLDATQNDLVGLAQILGHESLNTTARYTKKSSEELAEGAEKLKY